MKKLFINIILLLIIYNNSAFAGDENFILSAGINHDLSVNSTTQMNLNNNSLCMQYSSSISNSFSLGIKGIMDIQKGFNEVSEKEQGLQVPLFLILNHKIIPGTNIIYIQLGSGIVFDFGSGVESDKLFNTGFSLEFSSGINFDLFRNIGGNIEMGIIYKKFRKNIFLNDNSQIKTSILIGMMLDL